MKLEDFKKAIKLDNFEHGVAIEKNDLNNFGVITAYLPDMNKFAIYYDNNKWITFECSEDEFLNKFYRVDCKINEYVEILNKIKEMTENDVKAKILKDALIIIDKIAEYDLDYMEGDDKDDLQDLLIKAKNLKKNKLWKL